MCIYLFFSFSYNIFFHGFCYSPVSFQMASSDSKKEQEKEEDLADTGDIAARINTVVSRSKTKMDEVLLIQNTSEQFKKLGDIISSFMKVLGPAYQEIITLRAQVKILHNELSVATQNHSKDSIHKLSRVD